jgi:PAS domain S-box-containing protein
MQLQRQFNLLSVAAGVVLAIALVSAALSLQRVREEAVQVENARATLRGITNFRYLTMEAMLFGEARSQRQWQARIASFRQELDQHVYGGADEQALLEREKAGVAVLDRLFRRLEGRALVSGDVRTGPVVSALFTATQDMLDDGFELSRINQIDLDQAQRQAGWTLMACLLALALLVAVMAYLNRLRMLRPVADLQAVTEAILAGNMDARVNSYAPDELGTLARTFDAMSAKLQQSQHAMAREITERRSAQQALALAQADLQTILDHTPALLVSWDRSLHNRFANRACSDWFGLTPEQMQGRHMADVVGQVQYQAMAARLASVLEGHSETFEANIALPSGERRDALIALTPDLRSGRIDGVFGVVNDVSRIKHAEAGQALALRKLTSVLDAASDFSIIQTSVEGMIELFSPGAERMLGYSAGEMVACRTPAILHLAAEVEALGAVLSAQYGRPIAGFEVFVAETASRSSVSRDWTYVRKDGSQFPVNLTVTVMRDGDGEVSGYLGIAKDVSAERDIRRALAGARDQAEQASLAKSQFLANMSHEIRTPMNAVLGMLELFQYTALSPLQQDYADKARSAARSLLALLNNILDFSQAEANRIVLESAPFSVDALLRDLSTILSPLVGDKDVEVLFSVAPAVPESLMGDVTRLRQILINLASNAVKFTEQGEVLVSLSLQASSGQGRTLAFHVRDTGIGIAPDKFDHIFDGFSQAEASTTRRFGGTGLGLTISQHLVGLMGGVLRVESTPGEGSCFHFEAQFFEPPAVPADGPALLQAPHILIVDDHPSVRMVLASMVAACGGTVVGAETGLLALRALDDAVLAGRTFDVILLDWAMPDNAWWELAESLHAHPGAAPLVLMVTAHGRSTLAGRPGPARALIRGYVSKPLTPGMLGEAISAVLPGCAPALLPAANKIPSERLAGLRVLVVDDNAINQQVARELLRHEGAQVLVASSGPEALDMAGDVSSPFDAVLLDIQMPGMDGYACARAMRSCAHLQALPIIAMSADVSASAREACVQAGMNAHMGKPIDVKLMVDLLQAHWGGSVARPVATAPPAPLARLAPPATASRPDTLAAIDFDAALERLGGNGALFVSLATMFSAEASSFLDALRASLPGPDLKATADLLHTFKSAAGIVGAGRLQNHCATLEAELRRGIAPPDCSAAQLQMEHEVRSSLTELAALSERIPPQSPPQATDIVLPLPAMLDELGALLACSNMQALAVMTRIEAMHGAALAVRLSPLAASVASLDFPAARTLCATLRSELT